MIEIKQIINEIIEELHRAQNKHPPMNSIYEGIAIIREEYLELEREIFKQDPVFSKIYFEAIQLAAMSVRLIFDLQIMKRPNSK